MIITCRKMRTNFVFSYDVVIKYLIMKLSMFNIHSVHKSDISLKCTLFLLLKNVNKFNQLL